MLSNIYRQIVNYFAGLSVNGLTCFYTLFFAAFIFLVAMSLTVTTLYDIIFIVSGMMIVYFFAWFTESYKEL